jgi:hypothetical protein
MSENGIRLSLASHCQLRAWPSETHLGQPDVRVLAPSYSKPAGSDFIFTLDGKREMKRILAWFKSR